MPEATSGEHTRDTDRDGRPPTGVAVVTAAPRRRHGEVVQAEVVYREDLGFNPIVIRARRHPENVWALHGLHEALLRQDKRQDAAMIAPRLELALARADIAIESSCYCRTETAQE